MIDRQIEDMIAAAGLSEDDADELRAVMHDVQARRDAKLRGDVQRTVGETYLSLRESMERVIGLQVDTQGMVAGVVTQLESMEAAADQLRREFHTGLNAVGESVSQLRGDVVEMADDVAVLKNSSIEQEKFNRNVVARLGHLEDGQAAIHSRVDEMDTRHKGQFGAMATQQNLQAGQIQELTRQIEEMRRENADRPTIEEAKELVGIVRRLDGESRRG